MVVFKVSPDVVDIRVCCCLFVVCIYIRLVMSSYLLFCCIYFDAWCITCHPKQRISVISTLMFGVSHSDVVGIGSEYFVIYSSCVCIHICLWKTGS